MKKHRNQLLFVPKLDEFVARVAVGRIKGPYSMVFRIWSPSGKSDVYASVRDVAEKIKISLHETGKCNAGLTTPFARQEASAVAAMGGSRHQSQWTRQTHVGSHVVTPLQFAVPESELRTWRERPDKAEKVTWLEPPAQGRSIIISCAFTGQCLADDKWPGRLHGTQLLGTKLLPNGEKFWLVWKNCPTSLNEQTMLAEAQARMSQKGMVPFSSITDDSPSAPRNHLIFWEHENQLLVVLADA